MYGSPICTLRAAVAGELREQARRRGLDQRSAHPAREPDARAVHVGAGAPEDPDRIREVDDLDPDLLEERVRVRFDLLETAGRDDLDGGRLRVRYGSVSIVRARRSDWRAARPRRTAGCSRSCVAIWSPRDASGRAVDLVPVMVRRPDFRGEAPARDPRGRRGSPGAAPRSRRSHGTAVPWARRSSARPTTATGVSAMTSVSASTVVCSPVSVDRISATPSRQPRMAAEVIQRPPASA